MQNTLEQLYLGNISPDEQLKPQEPEYRECLRCTSKLEIELLNRLNDSEKEVYTKLKESLNKTASMAITQAFVNGYKLGSLLMMEVLVDK